MRRKQEAVLCFESNDDGLPKVVRDYRERCRVIRQVLEDNGRGRQPAQIGDVGG